MSRQTCYSTGSVVGGNKWAREDACLCKACEAYRAAIKGPEQYIALHVRIPLPLRGSRADAERSLALIQGLAASLEAAIRATWETPQSAGAVDPVGELAERDPSTRD